MMVIQYYDLHNMVFSADSGKSTAGGAGPTCTAPEGHEDGREGESRTEDAESRTLVLCRLL